MLKRYDVTVGLTIYVTPNERTYQIMADDPASAHDLAVDRLIEEVVRKSAYSVVKEAGHVHDGSG